MDVIKVAIADANTLLREGLKQIFAGENDLLVVGEAADEVGVAEIVERTKPDVLLLDLNVTEREAIPVLLELKQKSIPTKILILSLFPDNQRILNTAKAGACGCVLKRTSSRTLIEAIRSVHNEEIWVDRELSCAEAFLEAAHQTRTDHVNGREEKLSRALSRREREILSLVARGFTNLEISERLVIGLGTVASHLQRVFNKLSVNNRAQAVVSFLNAYQPELLGDTALGIKSGAVSNSLLNARVLGDLAPGKPQRWAHLGQISASPSNSQAPPS
jgi:DNA-binding NarL/FixJ family response regulator